MNELKPCPFCNELPLKLTNGMIRCMNMLCPIGEVFLEFTPLTWKTRTSCCCQQNVKEEQP